MYRAALAHTTLPHTHSGTSRAKGDLWSHNWASFEKTIPKWETDLRPDTGDAVFSTLLVGCGIDPERTPPMVAALVEHFDASAASTSKMLTMEILQAEFGPPNYNYLYDPDVNVDPLSGTPIEQNSIVPDFVSIAIFCFKMTM